MKNLTKNRNLRIVGLNQGGVIFIQLFINGEWKQFRISVGCFQRLMIRDYYSYWLEFMASDYESASEFFYNYGYENGVTYEFTYQGI